MQKAKNLFYIYLFVFTTSAMATGRVAEFYDSYRMTSYSTQSHLTKDSKYLFLFDMIAYHKKESFETSLGREGERENKMTVLAMDTAASMKINDNHYLKLRTLFLLVPYNLQYTYFVDLGNRQALNFGLFTEYLDIDKIATTTKPRRGYGVAVAYEKQLERMALSSSLSYKKYLSESYYECNNYDGSVPKCSGNDVIEKIYNEVDYLEVLVGGTNILSEKTLYLSYDFGINFPVMVNTLSYTYNSSYEIENEYYMRLGVIFAPNFLN